MRSDVIIIGGGIIGCSIAYNLAKMGKQVLVLESASDMGIGGSSRNGGGVRQSGRDPRELPLVMHGIKNIWPNLSSELGVDCEYHQDGNLRLGKTETHRKILEGLTARAVAVGLDVRMIDGEEVRKINPHLSDDIICASWCETDGHANPLTTTLGYYVSARKLGVRFITGEKVVALKKVKGVLSEVVTANGNVYKGSQIVLSAGYESRYIAQTVGLDLPMNKLKLETLVTEAEPYLFDQMLGTAEADFYGHQTKHGSFVFGGTSGLEPTMLDFGEAVPNHSLGASYTCRAILSYFPRLKDTKVVRVWAGYIDDCQDHVPILGKVEEVPGLILACGFSGHGFGIAPAIGDQIAKLVATGETEIDISAFRYDRFKTKA